VYLVAVMHSAFTESPDLEAVEHLRGDFCIKPWRRRGRATANRRSSTPVRAAGSQA